MSYILEKNGQDTDIVIAGWEDGIARSPLSGIGNMQAVNINTENKETSITFFTDGSQTKDWKVWVQYPATS